MTKNSLYSALRRRIAFLSLLGAILTCSPCRSANPFITSIYTADPSAHVWADGRLYVYPSRDIDPARGCDLMDHYHVFSTDNMVDWRDEGEILNASQVPWGRKEGGFMWAPDAAFRNGTYFFYFPHPSETEWNDTWKIGVAVSRQPAREFKVIGYLKGVGGFAMIDPAVFVDTDGQAYFFYGGAGHCAGVKLKPNLTEIDGAPQPMLGLHDFHEATWVFKRNNVYYLTYADNYPQTNRMEYATSSSPLGPWNWRGVYLESTGCDTTHGSVACFKGHWYQFYHNKSLSGQGNLRSICVDQLNFNSDGTIQTVTQTKSGSPAVGPRDPPDPLTINYGLENASIGQGAEIETDSAATQGRSVHNLHQPFSYLQWEKVFGGKLGGRATIDISYTARDFAKIQLVVNNVDYSFLNAPATDDWGKYTGHAVLTVPLLPGDNNVVKIIGGNGGINVSGLSVTNLPDY